MIDEASIFSKSVAATPTIIAVGPAAHGITVGPTGDQSENESENGS